MDSGVHGGQPMGAKGREQGHIRQLQEYERAVTFHMLQEYGITWRDACGEARPLEAAIEDGESPEDFVQRFGEKYDLLPKCEWSWKPSP